jgi:hypothetical protein
MSFLRMKEVQLVVMVLAFLTVFVPYFVDIPALTPISTKLVTIAAITSAFTVVLAVYSQFRRSLSYAIKRTSGWIFKVYMLIALVLMLVFALISRTSGPYTWVTYAVIGPLSSVNYSILVFYMASTAARAYTARNKRALMLLVTGFIVLLYQAPLTASVFPQITPVSLYIQNTFILAIARMYLISVTLGAIVLGMRVLLGKETKALGVEG